MATPPALALPDGLDVHNAVVAARVPVRVDGAAVGFAVLGIHCQWPKRVRDANIVVDPWDHRSQSFNLV